MNKSRFALLLLCFVLAITLACTFGACKSKDTIEINLSSYEAYRGAVIPISATLKEGDTATFDIVEGPSIAYMQDGALHVKPTAKVGERITVRVTAGGHYKQVSLTVGHTPVESIEVVAVEPQQAGATVELACVFTPSYANDNPVVWSLSEGQEVASIDGNRLTLSATADHTDLVGVIATAGGVNSRPVQVHVSTIQPRSFAMSADRYQLQRGESAHITTTLSPEGAEGVVTLQLAEANPYVSVVDGVVTVAEDAPVGQFEVVGRLGDITQKLSFSIVKTPVESINIVKADEGNTVRYGDVVRLYATVLPSLATYPSVEWTVSPQGGVQVTSDGYKILVKEENVPITFTATADGVSQSIVLLTRAIEVEDIDYTLSDSVEVRVGDSRTIEAKALPEDATYPDVTLRLTSGSQYAHLEGNVVYFDSIGVGNDEVVVTATAGAVVKRIVFHIAPIPVESIVISTTDNTVDLTALDTVTFTSVVSPANASFPDVTYRILEGESLGRMIDNVFAVWETAGRGTVTIVGETAGGTRSNEITLSVIGTMDTLIVSSWSSIDNAPTYLDGYTAVGLDMRSLPKDAGETVLIVSDDVEYLLLIGAYDGTLDSCWRNFYLYFLTTDHIEVCLADVGIAITSGFTDAVVDFGTQATVTLRTEGANYIQAGNAYAPYTGELAVDGSYSDTTHPYGMNGFGGLDGGIAVSAYQLTIAGDGDLTLVGGDGSSGTDGTRGASADETNPAARGGNGGYGGDSGRAIYAYQLTYDYTGTLSLHGGSAGTGGAGGVGGAAGLDGTRGADGAVLNPVYSVTGITSTTGIPKMYLGTVAARTDTRPLTGADADAKVKAYASLLANHYKVIIRYGGDTNSLGGYTIAKQRDADTQLQMLRGLDYALAMFGRNMFVELKAVNSSGKTVSLNLCSTIKKTGSGTIYGVTSTSNAVWFATFNPRIRDTFWSNYYNIMIHELFHLLTFGMGPTASNPLKSGLPDYNLGYSYSTSTDGGVYNPDKGRTGANSAFLTLYSKNNFNEDISDNLSLLCMLTSACDLTKSTAPLTIKAKYITTVYESYYRNVRAWRAPRWLRFAE